MVHQGRCRRFAQQTTAGAKGIARCGSHRAGLGGEPGSRCPMGRMMKLLPSEFLTMALISEISTSILMDRPSLMPLKLKRFGDTKIPLV